MSLMSSDHVILYYDDQCMMLWREGLQWRLQTKKGSLVTGAPNAWIEMGWRLGPSLCAIVCGLRCAECGEHVYRDYLCSTCRAEVK